MTDTPKPLTNSETNDDIEQKYRARLETLSREKLIEECLELDRSNKKLNNLLGVKIDKIETETIDALKAELAAVTEKCDKLRRLDAEYGEVEAAIIMNDPHFDGDSPHANCGARLIASIKRLADDAKKLAAVTKERDVMAMILAAMDMEVAPTDDIGTIISDEELERLSELGQNLWREREKGG